MLAWRMEGGREGGREFETISSFLGINICYNRDSGILTMDAESKIKSLSSFHNLASCVVSKADIPFKEKEFEDLRNPTPAKRATLDADDEYMMVHYRSIVGALIYISCAARPDVTLAVGKLSRAMHAPTYMHCRWLRRCLRYLYHNSGVDSNGAIVYRRANCAAESLFSEINTDNSPLSVVIGFADASYAPPIEKERKSITGFCFFAYGNLIMWKSKLQPITAASTHEAELIALAFSSDEAVWFRRLLMEIGLVTTDPVTCLSGIESVGSGRGSKLKFHPLLLYGDNKGSLFTVANPDVSHRSKHLEVRYYKIREYVKDGLIDVKYVKTNRNVADFFTKGLEKKSFEFYRNLIFNTIGIANEAHMVRTRERIFSYPDQACSLMCPELFALDCPRDVSDFFGGSDIALEAFLSFMLVGG